MNFKIITENNISVAVANESGIVITGTQSALDFIAAARYETGCERVTLCKSAISEDFFVLSTGMAGEILQKFVNYRIKLAIIGDFSCYTSKPLKDFIYECNKGAHIFFVNNEDEAIEKLANTVSK
jgi:hypothetical protein